MSKASDAWDDVGRRFADLGRHLKDHFDRERPGEEGEGKAVEDALRTLADAVTKAVDTLGEAVRDEEVHARARKAALSVGEAVGATIDEVADAIRPRGRSEGDE